MIISIPTWVFWTIGAIIGIPLIVFIGFFAWIGFLFWWNIKDGVL